MEICASRLMVRVVSILQKYLGILIVSTVAIEDMSIRGDLLLM